MDLARLSSSLLLAAACRPGAAERPRPLDTPAAEVPSAAPEARGANAAIGTAVWSAACHDFTLLALGLIDVKDLPSLTNDQSLAKLTQLLAQAGNPDAEFVEVTAAEVRAGDVAVYSSKGYGIKHSALVVGVKRGPGVIEENIEVLEKQDPRRPVTSRTSKDVSDAYNADNPNDATAVRYWRRNAQAAKRSPVTREP